MEHVGRTVAIIGAVGVWLPFAALLAFYTLAALTIGGIPDPDLPIVVADLAIVLAIPIATLVALRLEGAAATVLLVLVGVGVPCVWARLVEPGYSAPLHWITALGGVFGATIVVGAVLMIRVQRVGERG